MLRTLFVFSLFAATLPSSFANPVCKSGDISVEPYCYVNQGPGQYIALWQIINTSSTTCIPSTLATVTPMSSFPNFSSNFATLNPLLGNQTRYACVSTWNGLGNITLDINNKNKTLNLSNTNACTGSQLVQAAADCSATLPVELMYFNGQAEGTAALLTWATASELDNAGFEVERSEDGVLFETIGLIPTLAPNGNSNQVLNYGYRDRSAKTGINYYRLKQIDGNGHFEYSKVIAVKINASNVFEIGNAFPNPSTTQASFLIENDTSRTGIVQVISLSGQVVLESSLTIEGRTTYTLDTSSLNSGKYIVTFLLEGVPAIQKSIMILNSR